MIIAQYQSHGSTIAIIGGNSGMGKALIQLLLNAGSKVISIDIQKKSSSKGSDYLEYHQVNPLDHVEVDELVDSISKNHNCITGLVCLSGTIINFKKINDLTYDEWLNEYDISFKSCYNACKAFMPLLKKAPKASVVNMSSGLAFGGQLNYGAYTTAKASVISLSKTLAVELAPKIRVNTIAPGAVNTPFIYQEDGTTRFDKDQYKSIVPLGTIGTPDEMAQVILYLLSKGSSHITGQCIHVNGGAMMM